MIENVFDSNSSEEDSYPLQVTRFIERIVLANVKPNLLSPDIPTLQLGLMLEFGTTCSQETKATNLLQSLYSFKTQ